MIFRAPTIEAKIVNFLKIDKMKFFKFLSSINLPLLVIRGPTKKMGWIDYWTFIGNNERNQQTSTV